LAGTKKLSPDHLFPYSSPLFNLSITQAHFILVETPLYSHNASPSLIHSEWNGLKNYNYNNSRANDQGQQNPWYSSLNQVLLSPPLGPHRGFTTDPLLSSCSFSRKSRASKFITP
jgi:hypothetical protein